ncbi:hypothetical protein [Rickettsia endosymbiont of Halotydeus destructor]
MSLINYKLSDIAKALSLTTRRVQQLVKSNNNQENSENYKPEDT